VETVDGARARPFPCGNIVVVSNFVGGTTATGCVGFLAGGLTTATAACCSTTVLVLGNKAV